MDNTPGDKLGVWRDMRLADALVDTLAKLLEAHNIKFKMFADDVKVYMCKRSQTINFTIIITNIIVTHRNAR